MEDKEIAMAQHEGNGGCGGVQHKDCQGWGRRSWNQEEGRRSAGFTTKKEPPGYAVDVREEDF